jgi:hypothetical protein
MVGFLTLAVVAVIIAVTAYAYRNCDGQIPDDRTSL